MPSRKQNKEEYEYFVDQFDPNTLRGILTFFAEFSPEAERTVFMLRRPKTKKPFPSQELPSVLRGYPAGD